MYTLILKISSLIIQIAPCFCFTCLWQDSVEEITEAQIG